MVLLMQPGSLTGFLRAVPELKSNYKPGSQKNEYHVNTFFFKDCSLFKEKELSGDAAAANLSAPCSVINHRSTEKKKKKNQLDPVPILVNYFSGNPAGLVFYQETITV